MSTTCRGCDAAVRLKAGEEERLLRIYLAAHPAAMQAPVHEVARRRRICASCPHLVAGTTCGHCGCLVVVLTALARRCCPAPACRWETMPEA